MDDKIRSILYDRATIVNNIDNLVKYGNEASKNKQQLSLFGENTAATLKLDQPENVNYEEMIVREKDILGVSLTYNIFDRYILLTKRFCNNTVSSVVEMTESKPNGITILAEITDIEYRKSLAGNNYAKLMIQDNNCSCRVYIWGNIYQSHISKIYRGKIYLIELGYNKDTDSTFVINIKNVDDIDIKEHVKTITLYIENYSNVISIRQYVIVKMFSGATGDFNINYCYKGDDMIAQYKVSFDEEDYLYLKELITNIDVSK